MEKLCESHSHKYSERICREKLVRIHPTSKRPGTNVFRALSIGRTVSCTLQPFNNPSSLEDKSTLEHVFRNKDSERRCNAEGKAKMQYTSIKLDTTRKRESAKHLRKKMATKESSEDTGTDDSVAIGDDVTMAKSGSTLFPNCMTFCRSSFEIPLDISCH